MEECIAELDPLNAAQALFMEALRRS